ncbi:MAG: hypothetical protein ACI9YL_002108 [Luteibaculaceae bacterium]|jgi:hypothetical protein
MKVALTTFLMSVAFWGSCQEEPLNANVNLGVGFGLVSGWDVEGFGNQVVLEYQKPLGKYTAWGSELRFGNYSSMGISDAPDTRFTACRFGLQGKGQLPFGPWSVAAEMGFIFSALRGLKGGGEASIPMHHTQEYFMSASGEVWFQKKGKKGYIVGVSPFQISVGLQEQLGFHLGFRVGIPLNPNRQ